MKKWTSEEGTRLSIASAFPLFDLKNFAGLCEPQPNAKVMADLQLRQSRYRGGTARIEPKRVQMLKREGLGPAAIAASLGISRMSVYRVLKSERIAK